MSAEQSRRLTQKRTSIRAVEQFARLVGAGQGEAGGRGQPVRSAVDYVDRNSVDALQSAAGCAGAYHTDPPLAPYRVAALRDALSTVIAGLIAGPLSDASQGAAAAGADIPQTRG